MEWQSLIAALKDANGAPCVIYSDSEFWINVIMGAAGEKRAGQKGGEIKNLDIVRELYEIIIQTPVRRICVGWQQGGRRRKRNWLTNG